MSGLEEYKTKLDKEIIATLRYNMEIDQGMKCDMDERIGPHKGLEYLLKKIGVGSFNLFKCRCTNIDSLSDEEILRASGF